MTGSLARCEALLGEGRRYVIGVAGGSGSGKTTLAQAIADTFGPERSCLVLQDSFYIDQSARFDGDGGSVNFDHPSSLDWPLLEVQLKELRAGKPVQLPIYDFATHKRLTRSTPLSPKPIIVVDGTLILDAPGVRPLFDVSVFVQCAESLRYQRRLERDVRERGRTPEGVERQFSLQVKPMHDAFVEPSLVHAHLTLSGTDAIAQSVDAVLQRLA